MQEAMNRLQEEQNATTTSKPDILEYLAFSTYMQGMYTNKNNFIIVVINHDYNYNYQQLKYISCTKDMKLKIHEKIHNARRKVNSQSIYFSEKWFQKFIVKFLRKIMN